MTQSDPTLYIPVRPPRSYVGVTGFVLWIAAILFLMPMMGESWLFATLPGTRIWLGAGLAALAHVIMLVTLLVGWRLAHRGEFRTHGRVMTTIVLINWLTIFFVMGVSISFRLSNPNAPPDPFVGLEQLHALGGGFVQLLATYLVIRMTFFRVLPGWLKVRRYKRVMQFALLGWVFTALGGLSIFVMKYLL
jgi:uncharacterized membrane protein YozB (DUF420 family)